MPSAQEEIRVISSPFTLTENVTGFTHTASASSTVEQVIGEFQVPAGTTLGFGGTQAGLKHVYFKPQTSTPAAIPALMSIYKASPDKQTQRILLGQWHTSQFNTSAAYDKTQIPDIGLEPLRTIRTDEWILITIKADSAASYSPADSDIRVELSKLTAVTL